MTEAEVRNELFEAWLIHPVTIALMAKANRIQNACRQAWENESWAIPIDALSSKLPVERLAYLRGKSAAYKSLATLKSTDLFKETANDE
jgi:hypothetical protein